MLVLDLPICGSLVELTNKIRVLSSVAHLLDLFGMFAYLSFFMLLFHFVDFHFHLLVLTKTDLY